jgi:hypothetical protein
VRWRQVIGLWVVFAALAAEFWLVELRQVEPMPSNRPERRRFVDVDPGEIREVVLARTGRSVAARRSEGHWTVVDPPDSPIPSDLVAAFVDALAKAEEIDQVAAGAVDARAFGLDTAASHVELKMTGAPVIVTIGGPNPTGTAVYARRGEAPDVVLIGRNVRYYEDLIFQALPTAPVPATEGLPVGG